MRTITRNQLRAILAEVKGSTAVSLVAVTDARARKTGNPFVTLGPIRKVCKVNGMVGTDHEGAVVRQQAREGVADPNYRAVDRSWGTRLSAALVQKGDEFYLPIQLNPAFKVRPVYVAPKIVGIDARLVPVDRAQIAPFLPPDRTEQDAAHQGVDRCVVRRDYRLDSIAAIAIGGQRYRVRF